MTEAKKIDKNENEMLVPEFISKVSDKRVKIQSRPFGEIEISESQIIDFPEGILGFNFITRFAFLQESSTPFIWMQALEDKELAFIMVEPALFMDHYELVIPQSDLEFVGEKTADNLLVLFIVNIPENPSDMTANLQGPVIVSLASKKGKQAISLSDKYKVRHRIMDEMKKRNGEADAGSR